ncbi:MAG: hypothetical protein EOP54_01545 [Sphingobacteriales bacterium]|nr:MAG: hypothetical protein EOP54_01545 [Sphingobacteriales bacterium]
MYQLSANNSKSHTIANTIVWLLLCCLAAGLNACTDRREQSQEVLAEKNAALRIHLREARQIESPGSAIVFYKDLLQTSDSFAHYPTKALSVLYNRLFNQYLKVNNREEAMNAILLAEEVSRKLYALSGNDSSNLDNSLYNLAKAHRMNESWPQYKASLDSALKYSNPNDRQMKAMVYHGYSDYFINLKALDSAISYISAAKKIYLQLGDTVEASWADLNLVGAYYDMGKAREAIALLKEDIDMLRDTDMPKAFAYSLMAQGLIDLGELNAATAYLDTALKFANQENSNEERKEVYTNYLALYKAQGDYKKLVIVYDTLDEIKEAIINKEQVRKTKELEENFLIKEQQSKISELNLKNEVTRSKLIFRTSFAVVVFLIGIMVAYGIYQQLQLLKQKEYTQRIEVEQKLFGAQINPHFIFNALSAIQAEVLNQNTKKANRYLARFGRLMQSILTATTQEYVSVASEYRNLVNYLELQKLRFEHFDYVVEAYEGISGDEDLVPPMLVQPLLENAVEHGWKAAAAGVVTLSLKKNGDILTCIVADSGPGLSVQEKSAHKVSVSTNLIRKRLVYLAKKHKMNARLEVKDRADTSGVEAKIILPVIEIF